MADSLIPTTPIADARTGPTTAASFSDAAVPTPLAVGLRSAAAAFVILLAVLAANRLEPASLVIPGTLGVGGPAMVEDFGAAAVPERYAYDGQPLYVVAREFPDIEAMYEQGVADFRIFRGLQAALSSWAPHGAPLLLVLSLWGVVGVGLACGSLADLASRHGRDPRVGYGAGIALLFPMVITTTEPLGFGLGFLGLTLADRNRLPAAVVAFGLAGLARETALAMALAAAIALVCHRRPLAGGAVLFGSLLPFLAWSSYVRATVGASRQDTVDPFGFLDLPPTIGPFDLIVSGSAVVLMVVAVLGWRDVRVLLVTGLAYLGATGIYIGDQWRYHGLIRVSSAAVGLGVAALLARWVFPASPVDIPTAHEPEVRPT